MTELKRGTQIIYVPTYVEGDIRHIDSDSGFVVSVSEDGNTAFCRYWSQQVAGRLRTQSGSEETPVTNLVVCDRVPQKWVDTALEKWCGVIK